jgi:hypothetical protein
MIIWIYYSAQILYFGAELTKVNAQASGAHVKLAENTTLVSPVNRPTEVTMPVQREPEHAELQPLRIHPAASGSNLLAAIAVGILLIVRMLHRTRTTRVVERILK